jgi:single-stranded-DNA-specific exonuclease
MNQINIWKLQPIPDNKILEKLSQEINVSTSIATILAQRGITDYETAKKFFTPDIKDLHNPFLMKGMEKAVELIEKAIEKKQNILVYGDYDVDGTTAVSLVYCYLKTFTDKLTYYLPDRHAEGYGISEKGVLYAADNNISLIIALDCGIRAVESISLAKKYNINFIVCDHHTPGEILPPADAILNPKQEDCPYPYKELSGCGVGFKLIQAINEKHGNELQDILSYLDLVVVSIAADIVPMTGENRILAHYGLQVLNENPRTSLKVMIENTNGPVDISKIVFGIAPKINAAGRIKHANHSVELLICEDYHQSKEFLSEIEKLNTIRRDLDTQATEEAINQIKNNNEEENYSTVVYSENWHIGVLGIVASRLIGYYYRPTLVFAKNGNFWVASARSTSSFDLYEALSNFNHLFIKFGGHKFAAGLSISQENLPIFKQQFEEYVKEKIDQEDKSPTLKIDCEFDFTQLTPAFLKVLERMSPFGPQNLRPLFLAKGVLLKEKNWIGKDKNHLRVKIKSKNSEILYNAIYFNCLDKINHDENQPQNIVFSIQENTWKNAKTIQLNVEDARNSL